MGMSIELLIWQRWGAHGALIWDPRPNSLLSSSPAAEWLCNSRVYLTCRVKWEQDFKNGFHEVIDHDGVELLNGIWPQSPHALWRAPYLCSVGSPNQLISLPSWDFSEIRILRAVFASGMNTLLFTPPWWMLVPRVGEGRRSQVESKGFGH